ncbi:MAG: hypothetical protein RKP20_02805 [Candidatus Competibacter sp.]|nr:hypothetical protein [Candidatus Competibacter sp.]
MIEQILLSSGSFDGVRETGGFGQPLHALYPQIRAVLASEVEPEAGSLLAEPVVDRAKNRIDWYTEGDPERPPVALSDLPEEQRRSMLARIDDLLGRGRELAERYIASGDARRVRLGAILRAVLAAPAESEVFLVENRPVITRWGFSPDRPWDSPEGGSGGSMVPPPVPAQPFRDVAVPEIAVPELTTAMPESAPMAAAPAGSEPRAEPLSTAAVPEPLEPAPEPASVAATDAAPPRPEPESALKSEPVSAPVEAVSSTVPEPASPRYVVVGSRYFWSVVALAILLVLVAALWVGVRKPLPYPAAGETGRARLSAEPDGALAKAQRTGAELQARLEQLLVRLAERRGQCSPPAGSDKPASAAREPGATRTLPIQPTIAPPRGDGEPGPASTTAPVSGQAIQPAPETPTVDRAAVATALPGRESGPSTEVKVPPSPEPATSPSAVAPTIAAGPLDRANPPPAIPAGVPAAGAEPPKRTLEEVLAGREPMPAPRSQSPLKPSVEAEPPFGTKPPVKTEPTVEERREFANRLSAAGAATGEITVTLLWNSQGDLDLVVRCPSGRQLDYRNPAECGGTLDVDANASRAGLNDRPVENAFWPAGKAAPGNYEIAVRHVPRKDEQTPRETPFQVRLVREGQESVFKGTIRSNALVPVTTFTVER